MTRSEGWDLFAATHRAGDVVDGVVTRLAPFGVFLYVGGDVPALLVTNARPAVGSTLPVRVKEIDPVKHRVALIEA
ncbi:S1 RNA-binding domain-containing protein [Dactylosporangium sp. AC04546]|uniref:S1 RNA-binding domain-containing protein n=1 Tax=Dactylosporangium sp. AC04546 TaxID=2862460 RepID=UPI001EE05F38|nr:S1 RNA-binding domain-containing protein [Dactylosporangium sp. AC04546]WVK87720.1 S1 RNA-binding domain-containing protein [Dactylosporangium sp. AC04546]